MTFLKRKLVPHTDSNREPTDYKSASPNLSSLIILDSKGYWSLRSRTLFHGRQADDRLKKKFKLVKNVYL